MSFKREGNDSGLLGSLRKRRINDLLAEDVPEDEAKLLCNGRFTCLVCPYRPVFDTVNMLAVHRKGKKHAANEAVFLQKKKEIQQLILKRQHEQFMKDGTTNIKMAAAPSAAGGIQTAMPYDPRVKKHKLKPYDRKPRLGLSESEEMLLSADSPLRHGHQLKNIFRSSSSGQEPLHIQPYQSKRNTHTYSSTETVPSAQSNVPVPQCVHSDDNEHEAIVHGKVSVLESIDSCWRAKTVEEAHSAPTQKSQLSSSYNTPVPQSPLSSSYNIPVSHSGPSDSSDTPQNQFLNSAPMHNLSDQLFCNGAQTYNMYSQQCRSLGSTAEQTQSVNMDVQSVSGACGKSDRTSAETGRRDGDLKAGSGAGVGDGEKSDQTICAEKRKLAQQYLQLRGSGWKKDWDGKWIRDEDAEFDSDDEAPDLP